MFLAFPQGPGGFRELRKAGRNHSHLSWYLKVAGITSYGRKPWGHCFVPSTVLVWFQKCLTLCMLVWMKDLAGCDCRFQLLKPDSAYPGVKVCWFRYNSSSRASIALMQLLYSSYISRSLSLSIYICIYIHVCACAYMLCIYTHISYIHTHVQFQYSSYIAPSQLQYSSYVAATELLDPIQLDYCQNAYTSSRPHSNNI